MVFISLAFVSYDVGFECWSDFENSISRRMSTLCVESVIWSDSKDGFNLATDTQHIPLLFLTLFLRCFYVEMDFRCQIRSFIGYRHDFCATFCVCLCEYGLSAFKCCRAKWLRLDDPNSFEFKMFCWNKSIFCRLGEMEMVTSVADAAHEAFKRIRIQKQTEKWTSLLCICME